MKPRNPPKPRVRRSRLDGAWIYTSADLIVRGDTLEEVEQLVHRIVTEQATPPDERTATMPFGAAALIARRRATPLRRTAR